ncbi:hypothetical protein ACJZ2D_005695 [Fusarium nematophilum]
MQPGLQNVDPLSAIGSAAYTNSSRPTRAAGVDQDYLLELCDAVRANLDEGRLGPRWEEAMGFLAAVLRDETEGKPVIEFETIQNSRLDILLSDILDPENQTSQLPARFATDIQLAERLQRRWRARFKEAYFTIDQDRYCDLPRTGRLKDVAMNLKSTKPEERWRASGSETLSELEDDRKFKPGQWWLNLACAHRDGIVGSDQEKPTKGKYGFAALPLMTGREDIISEDGTTRYIREGKIADMHISLITQVGKKVRILRGHRLKSPYAPKGGTRYDGMYTISQYGQRLNPKKELHRMILTLEREGGQPPVDDIIHIPRPSELDDWELFQRYEGELIKQKQGEGEFLDWKLGKAEEMIEREQYLRTLVFEASLGLSG